MTRKPRADDEAWIDEQPYNVGGIIQLTDKEPVGVPFPKVTHPMGFDISPVKSSADRVRARKRKGRPKPPPR